MADDEERREPQFPAPNVVADEARAEPLELLEPPGEQAQAVAAAHLREHGIIEFRLEEHVYLGGPRSPSQQLLWNPAKATFDCGICDTLISTGEVTDEQVWSAQLFNAGLQTFLTGPHTAEERDQITRRYLSGELTRELVRASSKASRRRPAASPRPAVAHFKQRVQSWMLERHAARGVFERVIEEAEAMQKDDIEAWLAIAGKRLGASTLRRYWQEIDDRLIEAAKHAYARQARS
jgi:hypothetical protein